ncbi:Tn3 family transposase, partial [Glycomyces arizonensis]|uniref:Tn3 family transposase n=1 Tax=Glycomyces arizonensis TaxID=256035 RepID=UPI000407536E
MMLLFIATVHRIQAHADRRVSQELVNAFKKVTGKENILFAIAEAAVEKPDDAVRKVVYPAVAGGEQTLKDLVHEYKTKGPIYRRTVQTKLKASYSSHYRQGLIRLLEVLDFKSSNTIHRPVLDALELIERHAAKQGITYYPLGEYVPEHKALGNDWADLVFKDDKRGRRRVQRMAYEIRTFQALREALRCKEIWVTGAERWRNPDEDLPADFEARRAEHYADLRKPLDPTTFVDEVRSEMRAELELLNAAALKAKWLQIGDRGRQGAIKLTPLDRAPEPANLGKLKGAISRRWGQVALIDMLKEAVLRSGCLDRLSAAATRGDLDAEVLAERLMLVIYAYGTNTGIHTIAGSAHGHTEDELRYVRRRYLTPDIAQALAIEIANATFTAREPGLWGTGSSTVASDSTHFGAYDQNLVTEWHARYGGRGVLIYWHVEQKSVAIHSQLINCSASEVAAMIEGAMHHGTSFDVEGNMVDTHGQSEVGFGVTRLLGFDLLPRIKGINRVKLYRPAAGEADAYPNLTPAMTRPIRWDLIETAYDAMIKYTTAIKSGTASTEAILRRFMRTPTAHPAYQGMIELGRAQKTIFTARYLRDRDLQRQINAGLNVSEAWNAGNGVIYFGKGGGITSNRRDEQELSVLCLRILQTALVYVNTLMIQHVLADPAWDDVLTDTDRRGLTPLFWTHITPYGEVRLDMNRRLSLD